MTKKPNLADITKVTAGKTKTTGISPFSELEISKVYPNPDQPRKQFDDIEELAATIKEHGLLQPITVVKKDDRYMIISGERRYKAHLHNEAKTIKAYILDVEDEAVEELTLIENIQRNDLTDFEVAKQIAKLWESGRYEKKSDLAKKIGKREKYVSKAFSALKLDSKILEDIEANKKDISVGVMDEIARVKDKEVQKEVYEKYSNKEITRDEIKDFKESKKIIKEKVQDSKTPVAYNYVKENSPSGNLKKFELEICCKDGILYQSDIIEAINENQALKKAHEKYPDDAKDDEYNFFVTEIEEKEEPNVFEFKNTPLSFGIDKFILGQSANGIHTALLINTLEEIPNLEIVGNKNVVESFNSLLSKDKKYRIEIIEHTKENSSTHEQLKAKIQELEKEIEELKKSSNISQVQEPIEDNEPITIKFLELNDNDVTIEYSNNHHEYISYSKAKKIIKESTQEYIKYVNNGSENACKFIDSLPKNISIYGVYFKRDNGFY